MDLSLNGIQCFAFKIVSVENMILRINDDLSFPVGCMRQALGPGALGGPGGSGWRGRWEG